MIENLTIENFLEKLKNKEFSAKEFFEKLFEKIEKEDKEIGAFLSLNKEGALKEAEKIDELISKKEKLPPLAGVPCAIKDNILVEGLKCTAGSKILENYVAPFDATVIKKLKEAGAIIVGKTNLDEFAMGSSTEYSAFKITRNPHDPEKVPGGSSGGSAAAVAKNFCLFSLGSDTGGSIRQPAGFCKVVGLKPTYGAVSRFGLIAFASSLDQIGPMTKNVRDCEIVFEIIKGKDPLDSTSVEIERKFEEKKEIKVGIPKEYLVEGIELEVKSAFEKAVKKFQEKGVKFEEISLPHTEYALPCYYIIACAEASSNLARYDGLRYGNFREGTDIFDTYSKTRALFGKEVKRRIILGTFVLSAGYYEAFYLKAQKVRRKIKEDFEKAFERVDLIFTPVSPTLPFKIGEKITDPLKMYLSDVFTVSVNLAGLPAISIPIENLPVGLQIIGPPFSEPKIFQVAKLYERD
jgi:aspartyl-tRNA(Asn)/glutamyl-tRNA(Gln) amidotransferase subunit A